MHHFRDGIIIVSSISLITLVIWESRGSITSSGSFGL